jgi:hypothetical protein
MYPKVERPKENKSRAVANSVIQREEEGGKNTRFMDNRLKSKAQTRLQEGINQITQKKNMVRHFSNIDMVTGKLYPRHSSIQFKRSRSDINDTDSEVTDLVLAEKNYDKSFESGFKLMEKGLDWYQKKPNATKAIVTQNTHSSVDKAGYKTFWTVNGNEFELATDRGSHLNGEESRKVDNFSDVFEDFEDLGTDVMYGNKFNAETGEFIAEGNWGNIDAETAKKEKLPPRLPNSEIIWHQQDIARTEYAKEKNKSAATLTSITRSAISNQETLDTLFFCDNWPIVKNGGKATIDTPFDNDVWALLGSPNGNSSVHLLMQHGEQFGGVDIQSVTYETSGSGAPPAMTINYVKG